MHSIHFLSWSNHGYGYVAASTSTLGVRPRSRNFGLVGCGITLVVKRPPQLVLFCITTHLSALCRPLSLPLAQPGASINAIGVCLGPGGLVAAMVVNNITISAVFSPAIIRV